MSLPDGERYPSPLQSLVISPYLSFPPLSFVGMETYYLIEILRHTGTSVLTKEFLLPRHAGCVLSRFRCNGHSLLLSSYFNRVGIIENPSCSACEHPFQDTSHLILHCPTTGSLRCMLFGGSLSVRDFWFLGLHGFLPCPHSSESGRVTTTTTSERREEITPASKFSDAMRSTSVMGLLTKSHICLKKEIQCVHKSEMN